MYFSGSNLISTVRYFMSFVKGLPSQGNKVFLPILNNKRGPLKTGKKISTDHLNAFFLVQENVWQYTCMPCPTNAWLV